jgi:hypothetical protein
MFKKKNTKEQVPQQEVAEEQNISTPAPAKEQLTPDESMRRRLIDCQTEIQAALNKYRCTLDVAMILREGSVAPQVNVKALADEEPTQEEPVQQG